MVSLALTSDIKFYANLSAGVILSEIPSHASVLVGWLNPKSCQLKFSKAEFFPENSQKRLARGRQSFRLSVNPHRYRDFSIEPKAKQNVNRVEKGLCVHSYFPLALGVGRRDTTSNGDNPSRGQLTQMLNVERRQSLRNDN
jgi:hypothetical protein